MRKPSTAALIAIAAAVLVVIVLVSWLVLRPAGPDPEPLVDVPVVDPEPPAPVIPQTQTPVEAMLSEAESLSSLGRKTDAALALEATVAAWQQNPRGVTDRDRRRARIFGVQLGIRLAELREPVHALRALSAAAFASLIPLDTLDDFLNRAEARLVAQIWPEDPYIVVENFEGSVPRALVALAEDTGRDLLESVIADAGEGAAARLVLGPASVPGNSFFALPVRFEIPRRPFGIRMRVKEDHPAGTRVVISYHYPIDGASVTVVCDEPGETVEGWKRFMLDRDFLAESYAVAQENGYDVNGVMIAAIGIAVDASANAYWVDDIELYPR